QPMGQLRHAAEFLGIVRPTPGAVGAAVDDLGLAEDRGRMPDEIGGVELVAVALCGRDSCQHGDSFVRDRFLPRPWGRGRSWPWSTIARWASVAAALAPKGS